MKKNAKLSVSIVIPNWNGVTLMEKHLKNVIRAAPDAQIVVADDVSTDGSVEYLRKNFPEVVIVANSVREGFAGNVNSGVAKATGDIIVLINTDVEPDIHFLSPLLAHFADPTVFAVGCLEKSHEKEGIILRGRGVAKWEKGYYQHARGEVDQKDTAWVSGGSGAFRASMWRELGGMDRLFNPFYWEDIDLSYCGRKMGWKILFEPKSVIHHYHEQGKIKSEFTPQDVKRIVYRNQYIFIWKNLTDLSIFFSHVIWLPVRLLQSLFDGEFIHIQGFFMAVSMLGSIAVRRNRLKHIWKLRDRDL